MSSLWKAEAWKFTSTLKNSHVLPCHPAFGNPAQDTAPPVPMGTRHRDVSPKRCFTIVNKHSRTLGGRPIARFKLNVT